MHRNPKLLASLAVIALAIGITGTAFAAWSSTGEGTGEAQSTTAEDSAIAANTFGADLYPGAVESVTVDIDNPNGYPVIVTSITAGSSKALTEPACAAGTVTSDARALDASGLVQADGTTKTIPAGETGEYTLVTRMIANPADDCQGRGFEFDLDATLQSAAHLS